VGEYWNHIGMIVISAVTITKIVAWTAVFSSVSHTIRIACVVIQGYVAGSLAPILCSVINAGGFLSLKCGGFGGIFLKVRQYVHHFSIANIRN